jgi:hypothetical protein
VTAHDEKSAERDTFFLIAEGFFLTRQAQTLTIGALTLNAEGQTLMLLTSTLKREG